MSDRVSHSQRRRAAGRAFATVLALSLAVTLLTACGGNSASTATRAASTATTQPVSGATAPSTASATATGKSSPSATRAPAATATSTTTVTAAPTPTPTTAVSRPSATPSGSGETLTLRVYLLRAGQIASVQRTVPKTQQVAAAALGELLLGPTAQDASANLSTAIPTGTVYISTAIEGGTATVNLSRDFAAGGGSASLRARLAQVVYTLTQFPSITAVQFALDGRIVDVFGSEGLVLDHPQTRADYEDITPAILVESPTPGGSVSGATLRITGTANTFEATFNAKVLDANGQALAEQVVTATSGSGTRGTFDATLTLTPSPTQASLGTLVVYESSAKDGSPQNVIEIPIAFGN